MPKTSTIEADAIALPLDSGFSPTGESEDDMAGLAKVQTLPSGLQFRLKLEECNGAVYEEFQALLAESTQGGEKPEGFLAASDWLSMKLVEIEGKPLSFDDYDALDLDDSLFLDAAIEQILGMKLADDGDELPPESGLLPSGKRYALCKKNYNGRIYRTFKQRAMRSAAPVKGKAPSKGTQSKQALESISWLYTQLVEVEGKLLTADDYRQLDMRDAAFISNWMGKLLDKSRLHKI